LAQKLPIQFWFNVATKTKLEKGGLNMEVKFYLNRESDFTYQSHPDCVQSCDCDSPGCKGWWGGAATTGGWFGGVIA